MQVVLNSVPTLLEDSSSSLPSSHELHAELARNDVLKGLIMLGDPYWLTARKVGSCHGSISFTFIDPDGSHLQVIMRNPPFLFGNRTTKPCHYVSHPLLSQCDHCWNLGHQSLGCCHPESTLVCPLCGGKHKGDDHPAHCPNTGKHMGILCTCPPLCINCRCARKPVGGHMALSLSCPLHSNFCSPQTSTGDSSDKENHGADATLTNGEKAPAAPTTPTVLPSSSQ